MEGRRSSQAGGGVWPPPKHAWTALAGVALLYAVHLLYGALVGDVALGMYLVAALLAGGALLAPGLRADLLRLKGLEAAALLLGLVLAVGLWSLTPYVPGGPHPVWTYVGLKGGATVDRSTTIVEMIKLLGLACFFVLGAAAGARDDRARWALQLMVVAGGVFALWAFIGSATGSIVQLSRGRVEAHFLNANTAGNVFAALTALGVAATLAARGRAGRWRAEALVLAGATVTLAATTLATASRGAFTGFAVGLLVYLLVRVSAGGLKLSRALGAALVGLAIIAAALVFLGDQMLDRLIQSGSDPQLRIDAWKAHWAAFLASPLFGYGLGNFEPVNRSLLTLSNFDALFNLRAPLNVYLQWLEEGGLLMAVPMFLCIGWIMLMTLRGTLRRSRMTGLLAGLLAFDVVFLVHGFTDSALFAPSVAALWAWALGLQIALAQGSSSR